MVGSLKLTPYAMNFLYSNHLLFDCLSATYMLPNPLYIFTLLHPYRSLTLMV